MAAKIKHANSIRTVARCFYCGAVEECTRDHFIPVSKGGTKTVPACSLCQMTKRDLVPLEFAQYMENHPAVKQKAARRIRAAVNYLLEKMSEQ